jgi:hypothetical protein
MRFRVILRLAQDIGADTAANRLAVDGHRPGGLTL